MRPEMDLHPSLTPTQPGLGLDPRAGRSCLGLSTASRPARPATWIGALVMLLGLSLTAAAADGTWQGATSTLATTAHAADRTWQGTASKGSQPGGETITISKAAELDEHQRVLTDIYAAVATQDRRFATIPSGHFIRVTFAEILTRTKDLTLYGKASDPQRPVNVTVFPVYGDGNGNQRQGPPLATTGDGLHPDFHRIGSEARYRVLLSNLPKPTAVFDLRIDGGSLDADFIVDPVGWYDLAWSYRKSITIDHTKVGNGTEDETNFPVLISLTGLTNINANGTDIRFTAGDGTTELPREIESYASGALVAWVKVPTLSYTVDTVIYMYFGNAAASEPAASSAYGSQNVWDANYKGVWHLPDGTTLGLTDSTSNAVNLTNHSVNAAAGLIHGGGGFNSTYLSAPAGAGTALDVTGSQITFGGWVYPTGSANYQLVLGNVVDSTNRQYAIYLTSGNPSQVYFALGFIDSSGHNIGLSSPWVVNAWNHLIVTYNKPTLTIFLNGNQVATEGLGGDIAHLNGGEFNIGREANGSYPVVGSADELSVSNTARSAGYIKTSFNNQSSPSTFYSVGATTTDPTVRTWQGTTSNDWAVAGNWVEGSIPVNGSRIVFNLASTANRATNNTMSNLTNLTLLVTGDPGAAVSISGSAIGLAAGGIDLSAASQDLTVSCAVTLEAGQNWAVASGRTLTVSGGIDGNGALTKTGAGTLVLSGANSYSGLTTVSAGVLNIRHNTALGTTAAGTVVADGASLELQGDITVGNETLTLNGIEASGTGGTIANVGGYRIHTFTSNGTFSITPTINADILVVGGGGGGASSGGGGGAGGLIYQSNVSLTQSSYAVVIGTGGAGATIRDQPGVYQAGCGTNSSFGTFIAVGGGGGGGRQGGASAWNPGQNGGSGGGGGRDAAGGSTTQFSSQGVGVGYAGGGNGGGDSNQGGGGGGAGGAGGSPNGPANGGLGYQCGISGTSTYYASGGGGAGGTASPGGGTDGTPASGNTNAANATANTGGGGGGAYNSFSGGGRYHQRINPHL